MNQGWLHFDAIEKELNHERIHNHFVINTVSFIDGKKFCRTNSDYQAMRQASDRLCREYGLSVVRRPQGKGKTYAEWKADQDKTPTYRELIRKDIDAAVRTSVVDIQFYRYLRDLGYEFKFYTDSGRELARPSLKPPGATRFFRFDRLGKGYDHEEIMDRIYEKYQHDDGKGMSRDDLFNAMKYGSDREYTASDLGRFGLGLKSASLSQCRILTVMSKVYDEVSAFQWNLDSVIQDKKWDSEWIAIPVSPKFCFAVTSKAYGNDHLFIMCDEADVRTANQKALLFEVEMRGQFIASSTKKELEELEEWFVNRHLS